LKASPSAATTASSSPLITTSKATLYTEAAYPQEMRTGMFEALIGVEGDD